MNDIEESWAAAIRAKVERWDAAITELKTLTAVFLQVEIAVKTIADKNAREYQEYLVGIMDPRD